MEQGDWQQSVRFSPDGLVPVVVQDASSEQVLMLGYADAEAVAETLRTGEAHYHSRSRRALWKKGETSGCRQVVREILADCDGDALLYRVDQVGTTCHEGHVSCFHHPLASRETPAGIAPDVSPLSPDLCRLAILDHLWKVILDRQARPRADSYVASLLNSPPDVAWRKVGEEAVECICAALSPSTGEAEDRVVAEAADLLFHLWVALARAGVHPDRVLAELARRRTGHVASSQARRADR